MNFCLIMISKKEIPFIQSKEPRITSFPVAFTRSPKMNGLPHKNAKKIVGSENILNTIKSAFGKVNFGLYGTNIKIDYINNNKNNIQNLNNIRRHNNNCFGKTCNIMDRPYGPVDNQYILQGYQPPCATPIRSDLPIKHTNSKSSFGMTRPGSPLWKQERKEWACPKILVNDYNYMQNTNGNKVVGLNYPKTFSNDKINNFGEKHFIQAPVNSTEPFLTYAAGGNTKSRITGKNYLPEQNPKQIQNCPSSYLNGNLQKYTKQHNNVQKLLSNGFNSKYGKVVKPGPPHIRIKNIKPIIGNNGNMVQTAFNSSQGSSGVAQQFYKFPQNGNAYGTVNNKSKHRHVKDKKDKKDKPTRFISPLGIEISF